MSKFHRAVSKGRLSSTHARAHGARRGHRRGGGRAGRLARRRTVRDPACPVRRRRSLARRSFRDAGTCLRPTRACSRGRPACISIGSQRVARMDSARVAFALGAFAAHARVSAPAQRQRGLCLGRDARRLPSRSAASCRFIPRCRAAGCSRGARPVHGVGRRRTVVRFASRCCRAGWRRWCQGGSRAWCGWARSRSCAGGGGMGRGRSSLASRCSRARSRVPSHARPLAEPRACFNLGVLLLATHRDADAAALYEDCIAISPNDAGMYVQLGVAYQRLGDRNRAELSFAKAIELAADDPLRGATTQPRRGGGCVHDGAKEVAARARHRCGLRAGTRGTSQARRGYSRRARSSGRSLELAHGVGDRRALEGPAQRAGNPKADVDRLPALGFGEVGLERRERVDAFDVAYVAGDELPRELVGTGGSRRRGCS